MPILEIESTYGTASSEPTAIATGVKNYPSTSSRKFLGGDLIRSKHPELGDELELVDHDTKRVCRVRVVKREDDPVLMQTYLTVEEITRPPE